MNPKVSIILPTYNGGKYIEKAIESVMTQSFSDWELIIINDGSTDDIDELIAFFIQKEKRVIYLKNESNIGLQKTLNRGLSVAKGEYIARIDDDDIWVDKDKLAKQVQFLDGNMNYGIVGTGVVLVDISGKEITRYLMPKTDRDIREKILRINCFVSSSVVFRKSMAPLSGYPESILEDYGLWLEIGKNSNMQNLNTYSVQYCLKKRSLNTTQKNIRLKENLFLTKKYKDQYPLYMRALIFGYLKIFFYPVFKFLSIKNEGLILKIHKRF